MLRPVIRVLARTAAVALLAAPAVNAAVLWELTISGTATAGAETGRQTAVYRYDPDQFAIATCGFLGGGPLGEVCAPLPFFDPNGHPSGSSLFGWIAGYGPILSVSYSGLVNGGGGPSQLWTYFDGYYDEAQVGGTRLVEWLGANGAATLKQPQPFSYGLYRVLAPGMSGGEHFSWVPSGPGASDIASLWTEFSLRPVGLHEPPTLALTALLLMALGAVKHLPKRLTGCRRRTVTDRRAGSSLVSCTTARDVSGASYLPSLRTGPPPMPR